MLQKPDMGGYNKLSRRAVLKALGIGWVASGVTGCALFFKDNPTVVQNEPKFAALSQEQQLIDVFLKADQKLLKKTVEKLKGVSQALNTVLQNKGKNVPAGLASQVLAANDTAKEMLDHFDQIGLSVELDQMVPEIVHSSPSYVMPMNAFSDSSLRKQFHDQAMGFLKGAGFSKKKIELLPWVVGFKLSEQHKEVFLQEASAIGTLGMLRKHLGKAISSLLVKLSPHQLQPQALDPGEGGATQSDLDLMEAVLLMLFSLICLGLIAIAVAVITAALGALAGMFASVFILAGFEAMEALAWMIMGVFVGCVWGIAVCIAEFLKD